MNKAIVFLALSVSLLTSCTVITGINDSLQDSRNLQRVKTVFYYDKTFDQIKTRAEIQSYIDVNINYLYDPDPNVQSPEDTVRLGTGDCKAYSVLYMDILFYKFGEKASICSVDSGEEKKVVEGGSVSKSVVAGGYFDHAVVQLPDGTMIDPVSGKKFTGSIKFIYSFDEVFN